MDDNITTPAPKAVLTPRELADKIITLLDDKKASEIKLLHVMKKTVIADYFVICSGNSNTQIKAFAGELEFKLGECGIKPLHSDGYPQATWIVMDYGSVIVHIFQKADREFYKLERLWSDAEEVPSEASEPTESDGEDK